MRIQFVKHTNKTHVYIKFDQRKGKLKKDLALKI